MGEIYEYITEVFEIELRKSKRAIAYLKSRGINGKTAKDYRLGYCPEDTAEIYKELTRIFTTRELLESGLFIVRGLDLKLIFRDCIVFPIITSKGIETFTSRALDSSRKIVHKHMSGTMKHVYNEFLLEEDIIFITEAPIDSLSLCQLGAKSVALFGGSNLKFADKFRNKKIYIAFDNDADKDHNVGLSYAISLGYKLVEFGNEVKIIEFPSKDGTKYDANKFLVECNFSKDKLIELIRCAKPASAYQEYWRIYNSKIKKNTRKTKYFAGRASLKDLKEIPIERVVADYTTIIGKADQKAYCICPLHEDSNPSMTLYLDSNTFLCRGCDKTGDVIQFIQYAEKLSFTEACKKLKEEYYV